MDYPGYVLKNHVPSVKSIQEFTDQLIAYLFPATDDKDLFLEQHTTRLNELKTRFAALLESVDVHFKLNHTAVSNYFFGNLSTAIGLLIKDAQLIIDFDPAANSIEEVIFSYPGFHAITVHRIAHLLYNAKVPMIPRFMSEYAHSKTGIDIHPGATIGSPFFIDHGTGIVIGETSVLGNNVKIYQGVTLGAMAVRKEDAQTKRHPTIEDNVILYAGSTILGGNTVIGRDSIIGGNTWVTQSVPPFSVVYHKNQTIVNDRKDFEEPLNFII